MYRSIHSGLTPPTASTFLTKSNVFCGSVMNLGGNTDRELNASSRVCVCVCFVRPCCKSDRYAAVADPIQRRSYQSHKLTRKSATFGQARVPRSAPDEYLRKSGGSGKIPSSTIKPIPHDSIMYWWTDTCLDCCVQSSRFLMVTGPSASLASRRRAMSLSMA